MAIDNTIRFADIKSLRNYGAEVKLIFQKSEIDDRHVRDRLLIFEQRQKPAQN